jgi:V8-like Glu-specific endopeptidase
VRLRFCICAIVGVARRKERIPVKKLSVLVGLVLILTVGAVPVFAITWGELDTEHPNVGAMVADLPGYGVVPMCSGTLIHQRVFLTAGHCAHALDVYGIETVWVNFDQDALNAGTLLEVEEVIAHPGYNWGPTSDPHDVAVLILKDPVTDIEPAQLPPEGFLDQLRDEGRLRQGKEEADFTVVGYGGTKTWLRLSQNQATGDGGTGKGDSGGPSFWTEPDGTEILVGITSWGDAPCVAAGFNYRVDIPDTLDFIHDVIDGL